MVKITFLPVEKSDYGLIQEWRNNANVLPYCREYKPLSQEDIHIYWEGVKKDKDYNLVNDLFIIASNGFAVGVGGLVRIDWRNRKAEISFYVGEDGDRTKEIISSSLLAICKYAFETLNLHKIYFPVYSYNPYIPIYEQILKREYVASQEYYWDGEYHDRIILSKFQDEHNYEYLSNNHQL